MYFLRFYYQDALYLILVVFIVAAIRWAIRKPTVYKYSLADVLHKYKMKTHASRIIFSLLRFLTLLILVFLIAKPQFVDSHSQVQVEGIDIALVLDVSGSMQLADFDGRSRIDVAKDEAIRFIEKRQNDAVGLVIFAKDSLSRVPLTMDKPLLREIVEDLKIGVINSEGTKLATAMVTAANRLKKSEAKSKIMILLTDGQPSEDDLDPSVAIDIAKKLGIKVYTVGIGNKKVLYDVFGRMLNIRVNKKLLQAIAYETGGKFFMASDAKDMRTIYDTIDKLETTKMDVPIFSKYYDIFIPFVFIVICLLFIELFLSALVWFSI